MFALIFHIMFGSVFIVMSVASLIGLVLHGHEYTPGHFWNMTALCIASTLAWVWALSEAKEAWYILKSR
ncbi:hypothetical protein CLL58_25815 [Salmonella enterica subsp. enterica serovar Muenchen]|uniref:hypothetical protein n=1 Tax=unclassified Klebsiella TaxID=2608929 RepID=UPI0012738591|nr:hypothetical protein [Salmonella enterica]ECH8347772.1 hypothetical protein [Salmonella enterica subsp. enterica serovar Newport]ECT9690408.1 hypothetical protein [Salmonella enterica subsp. enterica serovar Muenchen]EDC6358689.1 hypothetical protein [Salmonella enterica subsp. enterica serovar Braenderup]EDV3253548.1 hypothetical protein [Salmonella enterica subsp. houtenae]EDX4182040.1 hypothetical protein [Salmonella enterica subsp. enterica serovar Javiana]EFN9957183.1 hypothetical pro